MKKTIKEMWSIILLLCLVLSFSACEETSSTGIQKLTVESLSEKQFYSDTIYKDLKVKVENTLKYEASDINVVIADTSIIDITFKKEKTQFSNNISYNIFCNSAGTTTFYFETSDKTVKSEKIKIIVEAKKAKEEKEPIANTLIDNSRTVYTTPTGKKYHYSKLCAGKNAIETTENSAKIFYGPCKKCAQ